MWSGGVAEARAGSRSAGGIAAWLERVGNVWRRAWAGARPACLPGARSLL